MHLTTVTYDAALHVAANMREWDKKEIYAVRWTDDPKEIARDCAAYGRFGWIAWHGGEPVAVVGAVPVHPGVWSVYMFATDCFRQIAISLTKFVRRVIIPALVDTGAHRAECASMEGHAEAHRWLELLGATREGSPMMEYGKDGENFIRFVWRRESVLLF